MRKKKTKSAAALAAALSATLLLTGCFGGAGGQLRIGAAGSGGTYYAFCEALAAAAKESGADYELAVRTTAGSAANLRLLSEGYVTLAVAQEDLAQDACRGEGIFAGQEGGLRGGAVAALYTEPCQVIVRADAAIESVEDLQGKKVSIGEAESGTEQNARQILAVYGLSERLVDEVNLNYEEAAEQLTSGEIDALFLTIGTQAEVVSALAESCAVRLLPVDGRAAQRLLAAYDGYAPYTIPAGTYEGQEQAVQTVGVRALLLASDRLEAETVETLTALLFDRAQELQAALPEGAVLEPAAAAANVAVPFHEGAADFYAARGIAAEEKSE